LSNEKFSFKKIRTFSKKIEKGFWRKFVRTKRLDLINGIDKEQFAKKFTNKLINKLK